MLSVSRPNRHGVAILALFGICLAALADAPRSCPPLRQAQGVSERPAATGPVVVVHPATGDDAADGSEAHPWRTIRHALTRLRPGDTLYLRGGVYYEQVYCAIQGTAEAPIVIRSYPGELAVLDGSWPEFHQAPETAWEPVAGGAEGEYRSVRAYRNARDAMAWFGDSMVGLSTYYHLSDLRATSEVMTMADWEKRDQGDIDPLWCGPGIWYDPASGHIHVRLAHTHLEGVPNYTGETDPRRLPLIVAPFRSVPLAIDRARYLRIQDLVIRGGGYDVVKLDYAEHLELDNVTIWCGAYGVDAIRTGPLKLDRVRFYGNCPPWLARADTSKRAYPGKPHRDITRLNTHAPLVIDSGREFSVFATPVNDGWEIANCEFTDSHDGPYLGGVSVRFHHNLLENFQDDGIYLSQMYPRHLYARSNATIEIYQNVFRRCLTALAYGGTEGTADQVYVYRNLFDLREPVYTQRATNRTPPPKPGFSPGKIIGDHGSPPWTTLYFYQNTVLLDSSAAYAAALFSALSAERPRHVFNNLFVNWAGANFPTIRGNDTGVVAADGNLYWSPTTDSEAQQAAFAKRQASKPFAERAAATPPGLDAKAVIADPKLAMAGLTPREPVDPALQPGSPAIDAGVALPSEWPDPLRAADAGAPDLGAYPGGTSQWPVGAR